MYTLWSVSVFQLLSDNLMLLFKESASQLFLTASLLHSDECGPGGRRAQHA